MRKTRSGSPCAAAALLVVLASPLAAQDEGQVHIVVSGRVEMTYAARDGRLNEAAFWTPGGLAASSPARDADDFVFPDLALRLDINSPIGTSVVEFGTLPLHDTNADPRFQQDRLGGSSALSLELLQAWIEPLESLRFGLQDFVWDPLGRGHPLFLAPSRCESPWGELPDSTLPPFPASGTNTMPQTRRDRIRPVGVTARRDNLVLFALLLAEGGDRKLDESIAGAVYDRSLGDFRLGATLTFLAGNSAWGDHDRKVGTAGIAAGWEPGVFSVGAEGYVQRGNAGDYPGLSSVRAGGNALRLIARYAEGLRLQLTATRVSGDRRGDDRKEGRFLSYEDNDATLIVEGNEFGLDVDSNYETLQLIAGYPFELGGVPLQPQVTLAGFRFLQAVPLPPDPPPGVGGRSRTLGTEIDATLDVLYSPRVTFTLAGAWLVGATALQNVTALRDDGAWLYTLGFRLRF